MHSIAEVTLPSSMATANDPLQLLFLFFLACLKRPL
jgi:hypothetical protein